VITGLRRSLLAGVEITTAVTRMTLDADSIAVKVTNAKTVLETDLVTAGYDVVVVSATAVTIANPSATPTPSPTLLPSTIIATVDSKTGGTNGGLCISDNNLHLTTIKDFINSDNEFILKSEAEIKSKSNLLQFRFLLLILIHLI
jgi:hypothetical protein